MVVFPPFSIVYFLTTQKSISYPWLQGLQDNVETFPMGENRVFLSAVDTKIICAGVTYAAIYSPSITIQEGDLRKSGCGLHLPVPNNHYTLSWK
jgi:hypothetical protein